MIFYLHKTAINLLLHLKKGQISFAREDYFEIFADAVLIGITDDKFNDCIGGKNI